MLTTVNITIAASVVLFWKSTVRYSLPSQMPALDFTMQALVKFFGNRYQIVFFVAMLSWRTCTKYACMDIR